MSRKFFDYSVGIFFIVVIVHLLACTEQQKESLSYFTNQMKSLFALKEMVDSSLQQGESSINLHNGVNLTIGLINTEFNSQDQLFRQQKAKQILADTLDFIETHNELSKLKWLAITFEKHETLYLVVDYSEMIDSYQFEIEQTKQKRLEKELSKT